MILNVSNIKWDSNGRAAGMPTAMTVIVVADKEPVAVAAASHILNTTTGYKQAGFTYSVALLN
jgi:hypothetical protein